MAFHEAFWIAVATAAPVVALAHVVALGEIHKAALRAWLGTEGRPRPAPKRQASRRPSIFVGLLALVNIAWDATALVFALFSLQDQANQLNPQPTAILIGVSLLSVATVTRLTARATAMEFGSVD